MKTLAAVFFLLFTVPALAQDERASITIYFDFDKHEIRPEEKEKLVRQIAF